MRVVVMVAGINAMVAGLAVAAHQMLLWLQSGFWPPIRFSVLWFALGGAAPDAPASDDMNGIAAALLDQPLCVVLIVAGVCIAWIGAEPAHRPWARY
jgi:hypothetical protein